MSKYRLFIGNPGAGKSTLANCIAERVLFKSGISFGSGKTYKLDKEKSDGIMYLDTPGFADINMRQTAASSITKALRQNGSYQIFFVVTLSAGRLRPEDLITIRLVLMNAPEIKCFSIIINKLSQHEHDYLQEDNKKLRLFEPLDLLGQRHQYKVFLLLHNHNLEDAEDVISNYPELIEFAKNTPWVNLNKSSVGDIPGDNETFKEQYDLLTKKISKSSTNQLLEPVRFLIHIFPCHLFFQYIFL